MRGHILRGLGGVTATRLAWYNWITNQEAACSVSLKSSSSAR